MRTKKALYNIVSQMSYEIVAMVCGLILPRFILSAFGSSYNGMITSITMFLDYISFLTLGISGSVRIAIYNAKASGGIREISAILKSAENYMRKVAYAFIAYMVILAFVYPYIVRDEFQWLEVTSLVVIIGIGVFAEYFFGITCKTFLMADQSMYINNIIQIVFKIINTLVSIVLIKMGQSIHVVKLGSAVCFTFCPILLNYIVYKKNGILKDVEPDPSALKNRKDVMGHSIANCVLQYTPTFLLTMLTTPATISVYAVYTLVLGSLSKAQDVFTTGLEAAFGELWAKKEIKTFEKNFETFEFLMYSFASVVFPCAAILILPFVSIYTKDVTDVEYILPVFAVLSVARYATLCLRTPYLIIVQAAGRYKETKAAAYIEAGLSLLVSAVMVYKFGLVGIAIGALTANLYRMIHYAVYISGHLIQRNCWKFVYRIGWLLLNVAIIALLYRVLPSGEIHNWFQWILHGVYYFFMSFAVAVISAWMFCRKDLNHATYVAKKMMGAKFKRGKR